MVILRLPSSQMTYECGTLRNGGMAEWSIATVLKTVGLTAPGVRIPLPPPQVMKPFSRPDHLLFHRPSLVEEKPVSLC